MSATPLLVDQGLRPLSIADAAWLSSLHKEAFASPWSEDSFRDLLALPTTKGWALEGSPSLILFQLSEGEAEILTFQIEAKQQGQGLGRLLLEKAMAELWALGAKSIHLEVAQSRTAAQALYKRAGFEIIDRRKGYYRTKQGREDALVCRIIRKIDLLP